MTPIGQYPSGESEPVHSMLRALPSAIISTAPAILCTQTVSITSGAVYYSIFKATKSKTISKIITKTRGTGAAATPTLCRVALCTVEWTDGIESGIPTFTKVAQAASDTAMWAGTFTEYAKDLATAGGFPASYEIRKGQWYAGACLVVSGATVPGLYGVPNGLEVGSYPVGGFQRRQTGQTDIPASYAPAALADAQNAPWMGFD